METDARARALTSNWQPRTMPLCQPSRSQRPKPCSLQRPAPKLRPQYQRWYTSATGFTSSTSLLSPTYPISLTHLGLMNGGWDDDASLLSRGPHEEGRTQTCHNRTNERDRLLETGLVRVRTPCSDDSMLLVFCSLRTGTSE
eukprot:1830485-Rhodomonas_salina.1